MHSRKLAATCNSEKQDGCGGAPPGSSPAVDAPAPLHRAPRALVEQHQIPVVVVQRLVVRALRPGTARAGSATAPTSSRPTRRCHCAPAPAGRPAASCWPARAAARRSQGAACRSGTACRPPAPPLRRSPPSRTRRWQPGWPPCPPSGRRPPRPAPAQECGEDACTLPPRTGRRQAALAGAAHRDWADMLSGFGGCARRLHCLAILFLGSRYSTMLQSKDNACNRDTSAQARFPQHCSLAARRAATCYTTSARGDGDMTVCANRCVALLCLDSKILHSTTPLHRPGYTGKALDRLQLGQVLVNWVMNPAQLRPHG